MQRKTYRWLVKLAAGTTLVLAAPVSAYWGNSGNGQPQVAGSGGVLEHLETGRMENAMWPYPYVCPDRVWAHAPFDAMVTNGWRRQNLLGPHHFDEATGKLTRAGELKVEWILTQTPPDRRQIFVERSIETEVTQQRIATAQQFAGSLNTEGSNTLVQDTHLRSQGRPASMVDSERNSFIESRLPAVLPAGNATTSSSSN